MKRKNALEVLRLVIFVLGLSAALSICFYFLYQMPPSFWANIGSVGVFLLSFVGASSILIPIPYTVVLLAIASGFDPLLLATVAGLGSAIGELFGYGLGYAGRQVVGKKRLHQLDSIMRIFRRYGIVTIFIFALTPLPDDLLFIPLGLMRYNLWKALSACLAGKFCMLLFMAYFGKAMGGIFVANWLLAAIVTILLALLMVAIFKIDWVKLAAKYGA